MYVGYAMFMVLRMAPTVAGTSITSDTSLGVDTGDWGRILAMGTVGAVFGKFIGGLAADRLGGRLTFAVGLVVSAVGVAAFAASRLSLLTAAPGRADESTPPRFSRRCPQDDRRTRVMKPLLFSFGDENVGEMLL